MNTVHIGTQITDSFILIAIHYTVKSVYLMELFIPYQEMVTLPTISYSSNGTNTNTNASMSIFLRIFYKSMISFRIHTEKGAFWTECITFSPLLDFAKWVSKVVSKTAWNNASILLIFAGTVGSFNVCQYKGCKIASHFDVNSHFPGWRGVECVFMCFLALCVSIHVSSLVDLSFSFFFLLGCLTVMGV